MKTPKIYYGAIAVFCIAVLTIGIANASAMTQQGTGNHFNHNGGQFVSEKLLSNLMAKGYDISAISAAVTSGDYATATTLMKEFRTAHPDAFPAHVKEPVMGPMNGQVQGQRMSQMLSNLTAKGYDVSAISAAVTSGDSATAMTLMKEFRTAHPDAFPAHVKGPGMVPMNGQVQGQRMSQMLNNLTAKGYDVSDISAAVTSGDYATATTLMKEFRTAHPVAFPAHAKETCIGHFGGQMRAQNQQQPNQTSG
jgi:SOS response regulatory protein OraA/RecX